MYADRARWLDVLFPPHGLVEHSAVAGGVEGDEPVNPVRDSLRALLLLVLFGLTWAAAMLATCLSGERAHGRLASAAACVGGGVFLATCLLDVLPEALESFEKAGVEIAFPVAECAVAAGFIMVLAMEQAVLGAQEQGWFGEANRHVHLHEGEEGHSHGQGAEQTENGESSHPTETSLGAVLLVLALSLHALFEGLSLAVINDVNKLLEVFGALIIHKTIIGFSLGVRLVQSRMRTLLVALSAMLFAVQVLIGGLAGISIMRWISGGERSTAALASSLMQGVACGTFLYITTFEVLPHEMDKKGGRLMKMMCLFAGFGLVSGFMLLFPEAE